MEKLDKIIDEHLRAIDEKKAMETKLREDRQKAVINTGEAIREFKKLINEADREIVKAGVRSQGTISEDYNVTWTLSKNDKRREIKYKVDESDGVRLKAQIYLGDRNGMKEYFYEVSENKKIFHRDRHFDQLEQRNYEDEFILHVKDVLDSFL